MHSELAQLPLPAPWGAPEGEAIVRATLVKLISGWVILEGVKELVKFLGTEVANPNGFPCDVAMNDIVLVMLPLVSKLVPRNETNMEPENGDHIVCESKLIKQVDQQHNKAYPVLYCCTFICQYDIDNRSSNGNNHKTNEHCHELSVIPQCDAIGHPAAIVVKASEGSIILPAFVGTFWRFTAFERIVIDLSRINESYEAHEAKGNDIPKRCNQGKYSGICCIQNLSD